MKVSCHYQSDSQDLTKPFPASTGLMLRLYSGDVCDPYDGNWFSPPYFKHVIRFVTSFWVMALWIFGVALLEYLLSPWFMLLLILTPGYYVAYRVGNRAGYLGWKVWGVDSEAYLNWLDAADVYPGSQALCFTCRPFATME